MEASKKAKRILLVLTDANPMDDQNIGEGAFYTNKEYTDQPAIEDTAREVQRLKEKRNPGHRNLHGKCKNPERRQERYSTENWCRFRILMILPGQWGECWEK